MDKRPEQKSEIPQENTEDKDVRETLVLDPVKKDFNKLKAELQEKLKEKRKRQPKIADAQELKINIKKPEKEAKTPTNEKKSSLGKMAKITPEQMNMLVNGISNTVTFIRKTEDVQIEETQPFATALFEVADANGWLEDMTFLPYLVLAASGTQLALVILSKPKKKGAEKIIQSSGLPEPKNKEAEAIVKGEFDVINPDELVNKINGR